MEPDSGLGTGGHSGPPGACRDAAGRPPPRPGADPGWPAAAACPPPLSLTSGSSGTSSMSGQGSLSWASGIAPPPDRPRSSRRPGLRRLWVPGSLLPHRDPPHAPEPLAR